MSGLTGSPSLRPAELLASLTETFTSGLSTVRSPSPLPDITTVATGRFHRRVFHPLDLQLASLHWPRSFALRMACCLSTASCRCVRHHSATALKDRRRRFFIVLTWTVNFPRTLVRQAEKIEGVGLCPRPDRARQ